MSNTALAITEIITSGSSMTELQSDIDLSDLPSHSVASVKASLGQVRMSQQRLGRELLYMIQHLVWIKDILGDRFNAFVQAELNIPSRTLSRYFSIQKVLEAHFSDDGKVNLVQASQFSQNALCLLSSTTNDEVMTELREMADKGQAINEAMVTKVLNEHDTDYKAQLASTQAEADAARREADRLKQRSDAETLRFERVLANNEEQLRRSELERAALAETVQKLEKEAVQVIEKTVEVEVVPPGFTTVVDAVNATNVLLEEAKKKHAAVEEEIKEIKATSATLKQSIAELEGGAEEFIKLKQQLDSIIVKYPSALLSAMSDIDGNIKKVIKGLGLSFVELGNQLTSATN